MSTPLRLHRTAKFTVLGPADDLACSDASYHETVKSIQSSVPSEGDVIPLFLDINDPYTRSLILRAFSHRSRAPHFAITLGPGQGHEPISLPLASSPPNTRKRWFQWSEYERIDWSSVLGNNHNASSYCVRKGLSRKAQLAHYTHRHVCKHPDSVLRSAIPKSVIVDTWGVWDDECRGQADGLGDVILGTSERGSAGGVNRRGRLDLCLRETRDVMERAEAEYELKCNTAEEEEKGPPVWIMKPSTINKGAGIQIVHCYEQVVDICWSESDIREWVIQRYITTPLFLRKRKFHIRAYALAVSAIRVYLFDHCLALCSGTRYNPTDTSNPLSHITNTAYQAIDPNFSEEDCVLLWGKDVPSILVQDKTCPNIAVARAKVQSVLEQMQTVTGELFRAYQNEFGVFAPIEGCFEHYGLDFVVDDNWTVHLLEVNPGPDFKQTGERLARVIEQLMGDTIDVALLGRPVLCGRMGTNANSATGGVRRSECGLTLVYEHQMRNQRSGADDKDGGISMKLS